MASPEAAFIRDECELDPAATVPKADLFLAWKCWCERNNAFANTLEVFSARLRAASNGRVSATKLRTDDGKRTPSFSGIRLRNSPVEPEGSPKESPF
jgi:putative DNA primase/helicase